MVETQMDSGYADRVPLVLGQLQDAISSGKLKVRLRHKLLNSICIGHQLRSLAWTLPIALQTG
jgi:hypothetical protein